MTLKDINLSHHMPVHFANNWSISRLNDTMLLSFWLNSISKHCYAGTTQTEKLYKNKTQTIYLHKLTVKKITRSKQYDGWIITSGSDTFSFHENRRNFIPEIVNEKEINEDDDDAYIKIKRNYVQTIDEINDVINPPPPPSSPVDQLDQENEDGETFAEQES